MTKILKRRRTEEERARRHLYGDKGAKFSQAKEWFVSEEDVIGTITTICNEYYIVEGKK